MTTGPDERLLDVLPAFVRLRDARPDGAPGFLASLSRLIGEQFGIVGDELDQLYDDLFVETCAPWVVPYLGDLVGVRPGSTVDGDPLPRAAVADAIRTRRRKGTAAVLEDLARDLTGWPARAVEAFGLLAVTATVRHVRPDRGRTVDLRRTGQLDRLGGPFDPIAHRAEARRIGTGTGRYNVPNVAVFVWRDLALPHTRVDAAPHPPGAGDGRRFRFRPLGFDGPLLNRPHPEPTVEHLAAARDLPVPITRRAMAAAPRDHYGPGLSITVWRDGEQDPVTPADIVVCDLSDHRADAGWSNVDRLTGDQVAVDPVLGRLAFAAVQPAPPRVTFRTGVPADTGGSELTARDTSTPATVTVQRTGTVTTGLAAAAGQGVVEILDSARYPGDLATTVAADAELCVRAAAGRRPLVALDTAWTVDVAEGGRLVLDGLTVAGGPLTVTGRPDLIELRHCTFVPGRNRSPDGGAGPLPWGPSLVVAVDADWQTATVLTNCVTGPLAVPADGTTLSIVDSIVDAGADDSVAVAADGTGTPGAELRLERCTVFGAVSTELVDVVTDSIVTGRLDSVRRQVGCLQYSWIGSGSKTARLHEPAGDRPPRFRSRRYGSAGYARLLRRDASALIRGSSVGGEPGAYARLHQTQRDDNLRRGIAEYLRFALEAGVLDGDTFDSEGARS